MKILFVASTNKRGTVVPFIAEQANSLKNQGHTVDIFGINESGFKGYLINIIKLRRFAKQGNYNIIHAHYILTGWVVVLALLRKKLVISLMGTDVYGQIIDKNKVKFSSRYLFILTLLIQPFVDHIISKSENTAKLVYFRNKSSIIPNGVNIEKFKQIQNDFRKELGLNKSKKYILFLGNVSDPRKNFNLIQEAYNIIAKNHPDEYELLTPFPITHTQVIKYLNVADVTVLSSFREGSPNTVKEAMACNCPVVATNVGDVEYLLSNCYGNFISDFNPSEFADKILKAIELKKQNEGRKKLIDIGLSDQDVAIKILKIYDSILP